MDTIAHFYKSEDAYLLRSYLESENIPAYIFDEYLPQTHYLYTTAIGIRVVVNPENTPRALELYTSYNQKISQTPTTVGDIKWWPIALIISLICSVPSAAFGRNPVKPVKPVKPPDEKP